MQPSIYRNPGGQQNYDHDLESVELQQTELLGALARMVKDPPLPADAKPTPENIQKWHDWWAKNKDTAQFVKSPVTTHE